MYFHLTKRTLFIYRVRFIVVFLLCFGFVPEQFHTFPVTFSASIIAAFFVLLYLPQRIKGYEVKLDKNCITIKKGVFVFSVTHFPNYRLVSTKSLKTPLLQVFGMCSLCIEATGKTIRLPPLEKGTAEDVCEYVKRRIDSYEDSRD